METIDAFTRAVGNTRGITTTDWSIRHEKEAAAKSKELAEKIVDEYGGHYFDVVLSEMFDRAERTEDGAFIMSQEQFVNAYNIRVELLGYGVEATQRCKDLLHEVSRTIVVNMLTEERHRREPTLDEVVLRIEAMEFPEFEPFYEAIMAKERERALAIIASHFIE